MDDRQFDELSKRLSTGLSRKGILKLLGGVGAAGISAASFLLPAEAKKKRARKKNKNKNRNKGHNNDNAANDTAAAQPEAKKAKGRGKGKGKKRGKNRKNKNQSNSQKQGESQGTTKAPVNVQAVSPCGSGKVLICHSGNGTNFTTNCVDISAVCGSGHAGHPFDCACESTPFVCPPGQGTLQTCATDNVACGGNNGSNLVCEGCDPGTACGAQCCDQGDLCTEAGTCCKPKTCADYPGQCGRLSNGCGGTIECGCSGGKTCCGDTCVSGNECCPADDKNCAVKTCETAVCNDGTCNYTPVNSGPGPNCDGQGETCCKGDCCEAGEICTGTGCCTPKTCAKDYPGQCGTFDNGCGGMIECGCGNGRCCGGTCVSGNQCCNANQCDPKTCNTAACDDGTCNYTPVNDGPGPLCDTTCCKGACCEAGAICTGQGCCTPKTCAADYPGQCGTFSQGCGLPDLTCRCPEGQGCCDKICVAGNQCCAGEDCAVKTCKTADCDNGTCDYTPVDDNKQGPNCTGSGEFCCGGENCCTSPQVCTAQGTCCLPKTCAADYPGRCGTFPQGCGLPDLICGCPQGQGCCDTHCQGDDECCAGEDCPVETCQDAACDNGTCDYTPVDDNKQGPNCRGENEFCCGGDTCCTSPQVCTSQGECCVPKTCAADYPGQCGTFSQGCGLPDLTCRCPEGQGCCDKMCVAGNQCCVADNCEPELCKTAACDDGTCDYTPVDDDEQGPLCDGEDQFCCGGDTCCTSPQVCTDEGDCCLPKTCAVDYPGQCGTFPQGCGLPDLTCTCSEGGCCEGTCQGGKECCVGNDCEKLVCRTADCSEGDCVYTGEPDDEPGTLCTDEGEFCCNGNECCEAGQICVEEEGCCTPKTCAVDYAGQCGTFPQECGLPDLTCTCKSDEQCNAQGVCVVIPGCIPIPISEACSGLQCGPASNGCGVDYDCGVCKKKKRKGQRPTNQGCVAGVCKPFKKKRCFGSGLAGQPCSGKCKCKNGRKCNNGRCCEGVGDGSRHCNSNSECCPGLMCAYRRPGQHRVCMPRNAKGLFTETTAAPETTATPGIAIGAILTGLAATMGAKLTGNGEAASVAMDEVQIHALGPRD